MSESLPGDNDFDDAWEHWLMEVGIDLAEEIEDSIEATRYRMDMDDGTHAQWREDQLGVLLVLEEDEVRDLVTAIDGSKTGNIEDWVLVAGWTQHFISFLRHCLSQKDYDE